MTIPLVSFFVKSFAAYSSGWPFFAWISSLKAIIANKEGLILLIILLQKFGRAMQHLTSWSGRNRLINEGLDLGVGPAMIAIAKLGGVAPKINASLWDFPGALFPSVDLLLLRVRDKSQVNDGTLAAVN